MKIEDEGRAHARQVVGDEMVRQSIGPIEMARKAGVDAGTVGDFISGKRWPQPANRHKIAIALGWTAESIDLIARGEEPVRDVPETVGPADQDAGVLLSLPPGTLDGLSPADREEAISAAKAQFLERIREIRRRLDQ